MSTVPPKPPDDLPASLTEELHDQPVAVLREISAYADALAKFREDSDRTTGEEDGDADTETTSGNRPTDVPAKATITVKEINGNRYDYWQWRDGEKIRSKYRGPAEE